MNTSSESSKSEVYCGECGEDLSGIDEDDPCPQCGSSKRKYSLSCSVTVDVSASVNASLIIGRCETDRLLEKNEYAAALLVSAVDLEAILGYHLGSRQGTLGAKIGNLKNKLEQEGFTLDKEEWQEYEDDVKKLKHIRDNIAHERGIFRQISRLTEGDEVAIKDKKGNNQYEINSKEEVHNLIDRIYDFCQGHL